MSEASRQRYLFLKNRLEEMLAAHGPPPDTSGRSVHGWPLDGADLQPSWGPVGSLARQMLTEAELDHILALDRDMGTPHAPEVASPYAGAQPVAPQEHAQNRVLEASAAMQRLDQYGETPLFACPSCGEESAKASVPLDYWRCTACGTWGKASRFADRGPRGPGW